MKKGILQVAALYLCLFLLCGCAGSASPPEVEALSDENDDGLRLTQTQAVKHEKYLRKDEFANFLSLAQKKYLIPGLKEMAIPQGMSYCADTGLVYISAYYKADAVPSVIMALDEERGELVAEYRLYHTDGRPFVSHVGGLAAAEDHLYVSAALDNDGSYSVAIIPLEDLPTEGSHDVTVEKTVSLPVSPSFLSYSQGILWVGNFYYPSANYDLSTGMNFTTGTADGDFGCYILGFVLEDGSTLGGAAGISPTPDYTLVAPDRIQGMVYCEDGTVLLSQSYGRRNNSTLLRYDLALDETENTISVDGSLVPAFLLDSSALREAIIAMPMTEGLTISDDGSILVLFESGAVAYNDGKYRTDHIWSLRFPG